MKYLAYAVGETVKIKFKFSSITLQSQQPKLLHDNLNLMNYLPHFNWVKWSSSKQLFLWDVKKTWHVVCWGYCEIMLHYSGLQKYSE